MAKRNGPTDGMRFKRPPKEDAKKVGRPTTFTPELGAEIVKFIRAGNYLETAARSHGVGKTTLYGWLARGRKGEEPFAEFADAVERAAGDAESMHVALISKASQKGAWQASAWWLERRFPKRFGRKLELSGDADAPIQTLNLSKLSVEQLKEMKALRAAAEKDEVEE